MADAGRIAGGVECGGQGGAGGFEVSGRSEASGGALWAAWSGGWAVPAGSAAWAAPPLAREPGAGRALDAFADPLVARLGEVFERRPVATAPAELGLSLPSGKLQLSR